MPLSRISQESVKDNIARPIGAQISDVTSDGSQSPNKFPKVQGNFQGFDSSYDDEDIASPITAPKHVQYGPASPRRRKPISRHPPEPGIERIVATDLSLPRTKGNTRKAIVVYYDALDNPVEGSRDSANGGLPGPPNPNQRPWLVQFNSSFLISCIANVLGVFTSSYTFLYYVASPFKLLFTQILWCYLPAKELVPFENEYAARLNKCEVDDQLGRESDKLLLQCLLEVIRIDLGSVLDVHRKFCERTLKTVSFDNIWYLFQPGSVVTSYVQNREQLYVVYEVLGDQVYQPGAHPNSNIPPYSRQRMPTSNNYNPFTSHTDPYGYGQSYNQYDYGRSRYFPEDDTYREWEQEEDAEYPPFILKCYYTVYDGSLVGPFCIDLSIPYFSGQKSVLELPVCPVSIHPEETAVLNRFQERGLRFLSWRGHFHYEGPTLSPPYQPKSSFPFFSEEVDQEVYVDFKTAHRFMDPRLRPIMSKPMDGPPIPMASHDEKRARALTSKAQIFSYARDGSLDRRRAHIFINSQPGGSRIVSRDKALELKEHLQLLPHQVLSFIFRMRCWRYLDVDLLRQIDKSEAAASSGFDDLVIPDTYRNLLISVIESYKSDSKVHGPKSPPKISSQMDIVRGKGRGLIILLHGPPGVGKTSTAETIAAYTKRPLYVLTSGDIGLTAREIEANLTYHFNLASNWGCIMLIDEADVFLMKRDWHDIERNALVSVFLRVLEYYSGILFLTTNRTGVIDEAFKSRMHLYLRYPSIDLTATKLIWGKLLDRIARENKENKIRIEFDRSALLSYAAGHFESHKEKKTTWNARQIRNAFQTAISLCQYDRVQLLRDNGLTEEEAEERGGRFMRVELKSEYFEKIAESAKDFYTFMAGLKGGTDEQMALEEGLRDDSFDPSERAGKKSYHGLLSLRGKPHSEHDRAV